MTLHTLNDWKRKYDSALQLKKARCLLLSYRYLPINLAKSLQEDKPDYLRLSMTKP